MMLALIITVGLCSMVVGGIIQWQIMRGDAELVRHEERQRTQLILESLIDKYKLLSKESNNRSHNQKYSEAFRERSITEAETWNRSADCIRYSEYYCDTDTDDMDKL